MRPHPITLRNIAAAKTARYTAEQCRYAIEDCHATLRAGRYAPDDAYALKLWAEIDACRDRMMRLQRKGA